MRYDMATRTAKVKWLTIPKVGGDEGTPGTLTLLGRGL